MILGITGSFCAGKDSVSNYLQKEHNYEHISLSDMIREELRIKKIKITRENLQAHGNKKRSEEGHGYFAKKALEKLCHEKNYVISSIRHPEEVRTLQKRKDFLLLFVDAPEKVRFERMKKRKERNENDPKTFLEFKKSEKKENATSGAGQQLEICKKMAKIVLNTNAKKEEVNKKVDKILLDSTCKLIKDARPTKIQYYLKIAETIASRGTCLSATFGALIVKEDQIISTGYVGASRGVNDCLSRGFCLRRKMNIESGTRYELCRSVHAEQNAIINAARSGASILDGDMYLFGQRIYGGVKIPFDAFPCYICKKMILNAGIKRVICSTADGGYKIFKISDWKKEWNKKEIINNKIKYNVKY